MTDINDIKTLAQKMGASEADADALVKEIRRYVAGISRRGPVMANRDNKKDIAIKQAAAKLAAMHKEKVAQSEDKATKDAIKQAAAKLAAMHKEKVAQSEDKAKGEDASVEPKVGRAEEQGKTKPHDDETVLAGVETADDTVNAHAVDSTIRCALTRLKQAYNAIGSSERVSIVSDVRRLEREIKDAENRLVAYEVAATMKPNVASVFMEKAENLVAQGIGDYKLYSILKDVVIEEASCGKDRTTEKVATAENNTFRGLKISG